MKAYIGAFFMIYVLTSCDSIGQTSESKDVGNGSPVADASPDTKTSFALGTYYGSCYRENDKQLAQCTDEFDLATHGVVIDKSTIQGKCSGKWQTKPCPRKDAISCGASFMNQKDKNSKTVHQVVFVYTKGQTFGSDCAELEKAYLTAGIK